MSNSTTSDRRSTEPRSEHGDVAAAVAALGQMTVTQLRDRYQDLFGEPRRTGNRDFLVKRLAWRVQSLAEGGLSERAGRRAAELARDADLRTSLPLPPRVTGCTSVTLPVPEQPRRTSHDRLPGPGTVLTRTYRGARVSVIVLPHGFVIFPTNNGRGQVRFSSASPRRPPG
jgi:hypothetical protein